MRVHTGIGILTLVVAAWGGAPVARAADISAADIMQHAYEVRGGNDIVARLSFTFHQPNQQERRLVYTMAWKHYAPESGLDSKVVFYSEFPPDDKGKAYLGWIYTPDQNKQHDQWMYLPELRMVRKMTHMQHDHSHDDDDFGRSELMHEDLMPRAPGVDKHTLLGQDEGAGKRYYVIESVPKVDTPSYAYSKVVRWITQDTFLTERVDYYDPKGALQKRQTIEWVKNSDDWTWQRVVGTNLNSHGETILEMSNVRLNQGLTDASFTTRVLPLGVEGIKK